MWRQIAIVLLCGVLAGCDSALDTTPARLTAVASPTPLPTLSCDVLPDTITCLEANGTTLLQTTGQTTLTISAVTLTFNGTLLVDPNNNTLAALEGTASVSAGGVNRLLRPGTQVILADFSQDVPPSSLAPYAIERARIAAINALPRPITLPQPLTLNTAESPPLPGTVAATAVSGCEPDEEWPFLYTVQRGDTLTRIAGMHDLTLTELQTGNCITDPNSLQPGEVLRVPTDLTEGLPEIPARFYADRESVPPGECATLYWQTENAAAVFLNMQPVDGNATVEVCPSQTSEYVLRVRFEDEVEATYTVRLLVVLSDGTENAP